MKKRLLERGLSLLLAFVMVLALAPVFTIEAEAAEYTVSSYSAFKDSLSEAVFGDTIKLSGNIIVTGTGTNLIVPEGVKIVIPSNAMLLLPYSDDATTLGADNDSKNHSYANSRSLNESGTIKHPGNSSARILMTMLSNSQIIVDGGKLIIGGEYSSKQGNYAGQTAGVYCQIDMADSASITVDNNGILSSVGYITGGTVNVTSKGCVYQPFIVTNYGAGTYTATAYLNSVDERRTSPFNSYAMINIQSDIIFASGGKMKGYCDLYAGSQHNITTGTIVSSENALFELKEGTMIWKYNPNQVIKSRDAVGRTTILVNGVMQYGSLSLTVDVKITKVTVNTSEVVFPLSYNFKIVQESGSFTIPDSVRCKVMPGAEIVIEEDAVLNVESQLHIMEGDKTVYAYGTENPTGQELSNAGYSETGRLVVNGKLNINGTFGGMIETTGTGCVAVSSGAVLASTVTDGAITGDQGDNFWLAMGGFKATTDNYRSYTSNAQVVNPSGEVHSLTDSDKGKMLFAIDGSLWNMSSSFTYTTSSGPASEKFASAQTRVGCWASVDNTYIAAASYTNGKMTDIKVGSNVVPGMGDYTLFLLDKNTYAPLCASRPLN